MKTIKAMKTKSDLRKAALRLAAVVEFDRAQYVDSIDNPADSRLPMNRLKNASGCRGGHDVVADPLHLHLRPGEAGVATPDPEFYSLRHSPPYCSQIQLVLLLKIKSYGDTCLLYRPVTIRVIIKIADGHLNHFIQAL